MGKRERKKQLEIAEKESIAMNPSGFLAAGIIEKAITDWRQYGHIKKKPNLNHNKTKTYIADACSAAIKNGFDSPNEELRAFFQSALFNELAGMTNSDPDYLRKHIGGLK